MFKNFFILSTKSSRSFFSKALASAILEQDNINPPNLIQRENIRLDCEQTQPLFDKDFKAASHHMVYGAGGGPVNNKRYVSTSSGGAIEGSVGDEKMMVGEFNTFMPQIECQNDASIIERTSTTGNDETYKDFLSGGESFYGRILKEVGVPEGIINIVHGRGEVTGR